MANIKKPVNSTILLSAIILFSVSIIFMPSNGYAEEISVKSMGVEKTSIITFTNDGTQDVKTFRIWLSQDANFESFKTEKGWIGEKNSQGVIVFSSSESIKENQSVKFGIKTDKPNPVINWKGLDTTNSLIDTGVISTTKIQKVNQNPNIDSNKNIIDTDGEIFSNSEFRIIPDKPNVGSTIRVVGENFGASQLFDFYIESNRIGSFETDNNGNFITTMKIPNNISGDRIEFKVVNNQGKEKVVSLRLGESENR
ncbi:MAG: biofilm-associated protein, partial [Nitrosopumilus sp.]